MSASASVSAALAASANLKSARLKFAIASMDATLASDNRQSSSLLQIVLDQRRLLPQELHVLVRRFEEISQPLGGLLEGFGELSLLLVTPGLLERAHLAMQAGDEALQLVVEAIEVRRKATQFGGIDA